MPSNARAEILRQKINMKAYLAELSELTRRTVRSEELGSLE